MTCKINKKEGDLLRGAVKQSLKYVKNYTRSKNERDLLRGPVKQS